MGFITCFLLIVNLTLVIGLDVVYWFVGWQFGATGVLGVIGFILGYMFSVEMSIAPRDFWWNTEFGVFLAKIGFAWKTALTLWGIGLLVLIILGYNPLW